MCAPAVPYVDGCFAVAPRSPERRCPIARRTGGRRTGAPPPRSGAEPPSRVGIIGRERPRGDGGRGAQTHLPPNPYQALGLGGRSRPGQCCPCGAGRPGRVGARRGRVAAYAVARVRIAGGIKCASAPRVVCARQCGRKSRAVRRSRSAPGKPARTPCREPVDRRSGARGTVRESGGEFEKTYAKSFVVFSYQLWEEFARPNIAQALGTTHNDVEADLMGEWRHLRNRIVHPDEKTEEAYFKNAKLLAKISADPRLGTTGTWYVPTTCLAKIQPASRSAALTRLLPGPTRHFERLP